MLADQRLHDLNKRSLHILNIFISKSIPYISRYEGYEIYITTSAIICAADLHFFPTHRANITAQQQLSLSAGPSRPSRVVLATRGWYVGWSECVEWSSNSKAQRQRVIDSANCVSLLYCVVLIHQGPAHRAGNPLCARQRGK